MYIIIIIIITLTHAIYNYTHPNKPRLYGTHKHSVAAVLYVQSAPHVMLFPTLSTFCMYSLRYM